MTCRSDLTAKGEYMRELLQRVKRFLLVLALALIALIAWAAYTGRASGFIEWLRALWQDMHPAITEKTIPSVEGGLSGEVRIHFIDVGQGDATFIEFPDGSSMLIDAGVPERGPDVVAYIRALGYDSIGCVLASHPHQDHIGGLDVLIRSFEIGQVWAPDAANDTLAYYDFLNACIDTGETIETAFLGSVLMQGDGWRADCIGPRTGASFLELNQASAIVLVQVGPQRVLLPADASVQTIGRAVNIRVDVLKVGHHGSLTSTSVRLIDRLNPDIAIISYGVGNPYGLPDDAVLSALAPTELYGTGANGTVTMTLDGTSAVVSVEREGYPVSGVPSHQTQDVSSEVHIGSFTGYLAAIEELRKRLHRIG